MFTSKYKKDDSISEKAGYSSAEIYSFDIDSESISIAMSGRWCSPHMYIEDLCKRHNLSGTYADSESGCDFFHLMKFKDGEKIHDNESNYFSQESIDFYGIEHFVEEYQWITEDDDWQTENDELIKLFTANGYPLDKLKEEWS